MFWSFRLARLLGVDIRVHFTFLLLLALLALGGYGAGGAPGAVHEVARTLAVFGCVVLHEFGHILTARRFGIQTRDVVLLPIGGVARLERLPERPREEFLIAVAGPAVNLVIAGVLGAGLAVRGESPLALIRFGIPAIWSGDAVSMAMVTASYPRFLLLINLFLLGFNLIPAYPMDGGRVLRSLLAAKLGMLRATRIAARVGQGIAMAAGLVALVQGDPFVLLLALFVFLGAGAEAAAVETRAAGQGIIVDQMMITRFQTIPVHATLRQAVERLLEGEQREFPVVDNVGAVEGLLTREGLIRGLTDRGPDSPVALAMTSPVAALPLGLDFAAALDRLRASGLPALPVLDGTGRLAGLLTMENISELVLVRQAVSRR